MTTIRIAKRSEKEIVQNIDQFYLYEFSKFMPDYYKLGNDGLFHDEDYLRYWEDDNKFPYIIEEQGEIAGFALVSGTSSAFVLDQFFVLLKFQGLGIAHSAATKIFDQHRGDWRVHSLITNAKSERFWPKVIRAYTVNQFAIAIQEPKNTHHVYRFSNW